MPWRVITPMSERLNMCRFAADGSFTKVGLARDFGVSRKTVYKWIDRYSKEGDAGVWDRSRRPRTSPSAVSDEVVKEILSIKELYPSWGPRKLQRLLANRLGDAAPSRSTVFRVLSRHGMTSIREKNANDAAVGRFERGNPNELWQTDFTSPIVLSDGRRVFPIPILDDCSRYCVSLLAACDCSERSAITCFRMACERYGLPMQILSDHGSAFGTSRSYVSVFTAFIWALEVEHIQVSLAKPGHYKPKP